MGIGPESRAYFVKTLHKALAIFYGERVPSLSDFRNKRRATYMAKLEELVDAPGWRKKIAEANEKRGHKQGVVTRMQNEKSAKINELKAKHDLQTQELRTKQQAEMTALAAHYETPILEADHEYGAEVRATQALEREAYFAALGIEDDHRALYHSNSLEDAIKSRVDAYIEQHLMDDSEGVAVQIRVNQEQLISDASYIADKTEGLRELILHFIRNGKLPAITVEAWLIENGQDLKNK